LVGFFVFRLLAVFRALAAFGRVRRAAAARGRRADFFRAMLLLSTRYGVFGRVFCSSATSSCFCSIFLSSSLTEDWVMILLNWLR
jgi:hypothetical protein